MDSRLRGNDVSECGNDDVVGFRVLLRKTKPYAAATFGARDDAGAAARRVAVYCEMSTSKW